MKVLVIGKGGREHALVHAVSRSGPGKEDLCSSGKSRNGRACGVCQYCGRDVKGLTAFAKDRK